MISGCTILWKNGGSIGPVGPVVGIVGPVGPVRPILGPPFQN